LFGLSPAKPHRCDGTEIYPNKLKVAISVKRCKDGMTFAEVLDATTALACFEKLKSTLKVIGKSAIALYISFELKEKRLLKSFP